MKKRKAAKGGMGDTAADSEPQPDVKEMMKQFGEMLQKHQQKGEQQALRAKCFRDPGRSCGQESVNIN